MRRIFGLVLLVVVLGAALSACGQGQSTPEVEELTMEIVPSETPVPALPDLAVSLNQVAMQGFNGSCAPEIAPIGSAFCAMNIGLAPAGPFVIRVVDPLTGSGPTEFQVEGLATNEEVCFAREGSGGQLMVDADNAVAELEEANNNIAILSPTLTPPPLCTPAP